MLHDSIYMRFMKGTESRLYHRSWKRSKLAVWPLFIFLINLFILIGGSVHPKGDQSWVFIGRTDAEAETPILWPPHAKS